MFKATDMQMCVGRLLMAAVQHMYAKGNISMLVSPAVDCNAC